MPLSLLGMRTPDVSTPSDALLRKEPEYRSAKISFYYIFLFSFTIFSFLVDSYPRSFYFIYLGDMPQA